MYSSSIASFSDSIEFYFLLFLLKFIPFLLIFIPVQLKFMAIISKLTQISFHSCISLPMLPKSFIFFFFF